MTAEAYQLLHETSVARIEREWCLTDSQRMVMRAMSLLSFAEGQSWALIPCQEKLATALRIHKGTVSRAIRACIAMGILERLERQHETLYRVRPNADCVPQRGDDESEKAMQELQALQRTRLQGQAEASGQIRLPGILPSEEIDAPADAFQAAMRLGVEESRSGLVKPGSDESDEDFQKTLMRHYEQAQRRPAAVATRANAPTERESRWRSGCARLNDHQRRVMELLREECRATNSRSEADLIQFVYRWRGEIERRGPRMIEELIAEHKYLRLTNKGFEVMCKFIDAQLKKMDAAAPMDTS